jgi:hypothetical protein
VLGDKGKEQQANRSNRLSAMREAFNWSVLLIGGTAAAFINAYYGWLGGVVVLGFVGFGLFVLDKWSERRR